MSNTTSKSDTSSTSARGKNWTTDDDLVFLEAVKEFGKGRWADIMNKCHDKHKCTHITDPAKFQKHFYDINAKKKTKYAKQYKRHKFVKPKGKSEEEVKKAEIHESKEQYNEDQHEVALLLSHLRERRLSSTWSTRRPQRRSTTI